MFRRLLVGAPALALVSVLSVHTASADQPATTISITPASPTHVSNCIPFGTNTQFGFTGFIYRNVAAFALQRGGTLSFDLGAVNGEDIRRNIYLATANANPNTPVFQGGADTVPQGIRALSWTHVVSDAQVPLHPRGDTISGNYELTYTVEAPFTFPGGGLIVGFGSSPPGAYADPGCEQVLVTTTASDASNNFYARFCGQPDQSLQPLEGAPCGGTGIELGGVVIRTRAERSLALNGSSFGEASNAADLNLTADWTVEAWFKDEDPNGFNHDFRQILMKGDRDANPDAPYYVLVGRNSILAGVRTGGQDYPIVSDLVYQGLDPKLWHHVAVTFNASISTLNLWLDGRHISYLQVPAHSAAGNSAPLEIGRNGPITGKYWVGKIDDVRIWNVARQGTDISATYAVELNGSQPGLVANWRFDEINGATATDTSGRNHTATLNGAAAFSADIHP